MRSSFWFLSQFSKLNRTLVHPFGFFLTLVNFVIWSYFKQKKNKHSEPKNIQGGHLKALPPKNFFLLLHFCSISSFFIFSLFVILGFSVFYWTPLPKAPVAGILTYFSSRYFEKLFGAEVCKHQSFFRWQFFFSELRGGSDQTKWRSGICSK